MKLYMKVLLQTYCCSWYGCQMWDLSSRSIGCMNIEWNKAVRRTLLLPYKTRTCLLPLLVHGKRYAVQHRSRIAKFLVSYNESDNSRVCYIGERAQLYYHGALGRNSTRCRNNAGIEPTPADLLARAHAIREHMDGRDVEYVIHSMCSYWVSQGVPTVCQFSPSSFIYVTVCVCLVYVHFIPGNCI